MVITLGRISLITHLPYRYSDPINLPQNRDTKYSYLYQTPACGLGPDVGETTRPEPVLITPLVEKEMRKQGEEGGKLPFLRPIVAESDLE